MHPSRRQSEGEFYCNVLLLLASTIACRRASEFGVDITGTVTVNFPKVRVREVCISLIYILGDGAHEGNSC